MIDRRLFLKVTAGTAVGGLLHLGCSEGTADDEMVPVAPARSLDRIGVQLYTVRTLMEQDFAGTLQAVADAGYDEVEFAGYFDHEPEEVRAILERTGLAAPATHVSIDALREDSAAAIAHAKAVGHRYIIAPWLAVEERGSIDDYRRLAALFNDIGQACRDEGLRFGWHNHEFEFEETDGEIPFDVLLDETDPELVVFELDLFWTVVGGHDPLDYFERYPGRFPLCHVKDRAEDGTMVDVGAGGIDFAGIFARAEQAGLEHFFVEHDEPADPIASITASHDYLAALTY